MRAVVTGLKFLARTPPTGRGKCPIDRYTFPPQDFDADDGDELFTNDGKTLGDIVDIDNATSWVDVKKRLKRVDEHPENAFVQKRGHSHGLRFVGTLKSEPDLNVLAVFEK